MTKVRGGQASQQKQRVTETAAQASQQAVIKRPQAEGPLSEAQIADRSGLAELDAEQARALVEDQGKGEPGVGSLLGVMSDNRQQAQQGLTAEALSQAVTDIKSRYKTDIYDGVEDHVRNAHQAVAEAQAALPKADAAQLRRHYLGFLDREPHRTDSAQEQMQQLTRAGAQLPNASLSELHQVITRLHDVEETAILARKPFESIVEAAAKDPSQSVSGLLDQYLEIREQKSFMFKRARAVDDFRAAQGLPAD